MGLAHVQRLLVELYTDAALREQFFADPRAACEVFRLSPNEAQQLGQLSSEQVGFFANSLRRKRLNAVGKLLPLTKRALGDYFAELFGQYADSFMPSGTAKHRQDAIAFVAYIEEALSVHTTEPTRAVGLARYEAAWLKAADPTSRWIVCRLREPISRLVRCARHDAPSPRATVALWFRLSPRSRLRHVVLSRPRLWQ